MCGVFVEKEAAGFVHRVVLVGGFLSWIDMIRCGSLKEPCKLASRTDLGVSQYRQKSLLKESSTIISGAWSGVKRLGMKLKKAV